MKPTLILRFYSIFGFLIYGLTLMYYFLATGLFFPLWFSFGCFILSLYCLLRSLFFRLDSALWIGMFLLLISIFGLLRFMEPIDNTKYIALYFFAGSVSSFSVAVLFKNFLFIKISLILILEVILILLYSINIINIGVFIFLNSLFLMILLIGISTHLKNNLKSIKK